MKNTEITDNLAAHGFRVARMLGYSKGHYIDANPDNFVLFNANIVSNNEGGKVWYGDLDLTKDFDQLKHIAEEMDDTFYFLREMDGRFENEDIGVDQTINVSVWSTAEERAPVYEDHFYES